MNHKVLNSVSGSIYYDKTSVILTWNADARNSNSSCILTAFVFWQFHFVGSFHLCWTKQYSLFIEMILILSRFVLWEHTHVHTYIVHTYIHTYIHTHIHSTYVRTYVHTNTHTLKKKIKLHNNWNYFKLKTKICQQICNTVAKTDIRWS